MLPLSSFTITLGKSYHYLRMTSLLHVFAVFVLFNSSLPMWLLISMLLIVLLSIIHIARSRRPEPAYYQLSYHKKYWLLHGIDGQRIPYEQVHISFDAGLFVLLTLTGEKTSKKLVVFTDQLSTFQYRALHIIGKIIPKKRKALSVRK